MSYLRRFGPRTATPQTEPIPGTAQVPNDAGGYSFAVDDWTQLERWLILGSAGGTYYVGERKLTRENAAVVERCLQADAELTIDLIVSISEAGRAASNDPALFALALATASADLKTKRLAEAAWPKVARTGTHFLHLFQYVHNQRSAGPLVRRAVSAWYQNRPAEDLAFQVLKYQSRDGFSQRDVLRLARPKAKDETYNTIFHWVRNGWEGVGEQPHDNPALRQIWAAEKAKHASDAREVASLIRTYRLPREVIPTPFLNDREVWEALLEGMPLEALLRNLAKLTQVGILSAEGEETEAVANRLRDAEAIKRARLHPIKVLAALTTYESGHGVRGSGSWEPVPSIVAALNEAFYLSFGNVTPTGKRILLAIDVSGSMHGTLVNGIPGMTCHTAASAMAMVTARTEADYRVIGFDTVAHTFEVTPEQRLDEVVGMVSKLGGGGTNCALPMLWALQNKVEVDAFVLYSDSETWAGSLHPVQALAEYRKQVNPEARIVNVQMAAVRWTNNGPNDRLALECVGFDTAAPGLIGEFVAGKL